MSVVVGPPLYRHLCRVCAYESLHNARGCTDCKTPRWTKPIALTGNARTTLLTFRSPGVGRKRTTVGENSRVRLTQRRTAPRSTLTHARVATSSKRGARKLTEAQVRDARERYQHGVSFARMARDYGVHHTTLRDAVLGWTWAYLPDACELRRGVPASSNNQAACSSSRLQYRAAAASAPIAAAPIQEAT